MRDLGTMGESQFLNWCAEAGLVANKSNVDRNGWDFIVEFPLELNFTGTNIHKAPHECRVQVKATDQRSRKIQIGLANLKRLATAPTPSFFVFIEYDGQATPQRAFVVHLDQGLIHKILKSVHEKKSAQPNVEINLNRYKTTIKYDEKNLIEVSSGNGLKEKLFQYIGADFDEYVAQKIQFLKKVGYEKDSGEVSFTIMGHEDARNFVDISLGSKAKVQVHNIRGFVSRFGLKDSVPFINEETATLEIPDTKPVDTGFLKFKDQPLSNPITFEAKLFGSPIVNFLPKSEQKYRIDCGIFEVHIYPYKNSANIIFHLDQTDSYEVNQLKKLFKLIELINTTDKIMVLTELATLPKVEQHILSSKNLNVSYENELKTLNCINQLLSYFDITDSLSLSFRQLNHLIQHTCILKKIIFCEKEVSNILKVSFNAKVDEAGPNTSHDQKVACLVPLGTKIGGFMLTIWIVGFGYLEEEQSTEERYSVKFENYNLEKTMFAKTEDFPEIEVLKQEIKPIVDKYDNNGEYKLFIVDFNELF